MFQAPNKSIMERGTSGNALGHSIPSFWKMIVEDIA
jgi:hypothetical protein